MACSYASHAFGRGPKYTLVAVQPNGPVLAKLADLVETGKLRVNVDKVFPLKEARWALYDSAGPGLLHISAPCMPASAWEQWCTCMLDSRLLHHGCKQHVALSRQAVRKACTAAQCAPWHPCSSPAYAQISALACGAAAADLVSASA